MQVVINSSSETGKLCGVYMEVGIHSRNGNRTSTIAEWDDEYYFTWSSEMYPRNVAEFLASTSSISCEENNDDEDDDIEEDDVNDVFEVECDNDDNPYM